jgi:hypothetical protein
VKKLLVAGLLALGLVLTSQQQASAWSKWSFNAGISVNYEGGNNSFLWGLSRSGQVPGYPTDVIGCGPFGNGNGGLPGAYGYGGYGGYGGYPLDYHAAAPVTPTAPGAGQPQPAGQPQNGKQAETQAVYYSGYNYQPSNYYYPANTNYYNYQSSGFGGYGYQVPSYWYGR